MCRKTGGGGSYGGGGNMAAAGRTAFAERTRTAEALKEGHTTTAAARCTSELLPKRLFLAVHHSFSDAVFSSQNSVVTRLRERDPIKFSVTFPFLLIVFD